MRDLTVALAQGVLHWESPADNRNYFEAMIRDSGQSLDLIVLPEMFNSGFSMNAAENAETMDGPSVAWMSAMAHSEQAAVCGSLAIAQDGAVYNRLVFARPDGAISCYDKRHLFRMAGEHERYAAGKSKIIIDWRGWRICPLVCYDLRFPAWSRSPDDYDLLIYVANWPRARRTHWRQLLIARAIENLSAVIGVNRVGMDGNDVSYSGDSMVIDAMGNLLLDPGEEVGLHICTLERQTQRDYRDSFPAHMDADRFVVTD